MSDAGDVPGEVDDLLVEEASLVARTHEVRRRLAELRESLRRRDRASHQLALAFGSDVGRTDGPQPR